MQSIRYQLKRTTTEVLELVPPYVATDLMGFRSSGRAAGQIHCRGNGDSDQPACGGRDLRRKREASSIRCGERPIRRGLQWSKRRYVEGRDLSARVMS